VTHYARGVCARSGACSHNLCMATVLSPMGAREVLRCDICHLTQFPAKNNHCRRCHRGLDEVPEPEPRPEPAAADHLCAGALPAPALSSLLRMLRLRVGLSQRQLADRIKTPRTYVSKIENGKCAPSLHTLGRLALALEVSLADLLESVERSRQSELAELRKDPLIGALLPLIPRLGEEQRRTILARMADLAIMAQRRTA